MSGGWESGAARPNAGDWENVLQRIFLEFSISAATSPNLSNEVWITSVVDYLRQQLQFPRSELLEELQKSLEAVSPSGLLNLEQFKEGLQRWIAVVESLHWQDGNNNVLMKGRANTMAGPMGASMKNETEVGSNLADIYQLKVHIRRSEEENTALQEEIIEAEHTITSLKRKEEATRRKLDEVNDKYEQVLKEIDGMRDVINNLQRRETTHISSLQTLKKQSKQLQENLDTAEEQLQVVPPLRRKLEKLFKDKVALKKQITSLSKEIVTKQSECDSLQTEVNRLEKLCQLQDYTIRDLREKKETLLSKFESECLGNLSTIENHSDSTLPYIKHCYMQNSTPYKTDESGDHNSLYMELKASGFTTECGRNDSRNRELEGELQWYKDELPTMLEQLESVVQRLAAFSGKTYVPILRLDSVDDSNGESISMLKEGLSFLNDNVTEMISRSRRDAATQTSTLEETTTEPYLGEFNVHDFQDHSIYQEIKEKERLLKNQDSSDFKKYRTAIFTSDSSESPSPRRRESLMNEDLEQISVRPQIKKVLLAPPKLNLPLNNKRSSAEASGDSQSKQEAFGNVNLRRNYSVGSEISFLGSPSESLTSSERTEVREQQEKCKNSETYVVDSVFIEDGMNDQPKTPERPTTTAEAGTSEEWGSPESRGAQTSVLRAMSKREDVEGVGVVQTPLERETTTVICTTDPSSCSTPVYGSESRKGKENVGHGKREKQQRILGDKRSLSEGETRTECSCRTSSGDSREVSLKQGELRIFPSLGDARLQESGIANLPDDNSICSESLSDADLERKYTAFSIGLSTDRTSLRQRISLSTRQRDQSEKNLSCEVHKMQQDIQELAPLCTDRESIERVERVRQQLDMIAQCAHRVSCAAETLGAVHQEHRVSRAMLLADRYLQLLRTKCEKLAGEVAETKRILVENNIVIEEHPGELGEDIPRIRYRSGPANNRMMMARRRASIATITRPVGLSQDTKDIVRQRNSVTGRVTLRRLSLSYETQKWEAEKLDRTDSSNSIGELRDIFEQAESRRNSKEENNNIVQRINSNSSSTMHYSTGKSETWSTATQELSAEVPSVENVLRQTRICTRTPFSCSFLLENNVSALLCVLAFFLGFYACYFFTSVNWYFIEDVLNPYLQLRHSRPPPL